MTQQDRFTPRVSCYVPQHMKKEKPFDRLRALGRKQDRSLNWMIVDAVLFYLKHQEKKSK